MSFEDRPKKKFCEEFIELFFENIPATLRFEFRTYYLELWESLEGNAGRNQWGRDELHDELVKIFKDEGYNTMSDFFAVLTEKGRKAKDAGGHFKYLKEKKEENRKSQIEFVAKVYVPIAALLIGLGGIIISVLALTKNTPAPQVQVTPNITIKIDSSILPATQLPKAIKSRNNQ